MDTKIRDNFIGQWKKYFNKAELPITFYYSDNPVNATLFTASRNHWLRNIITSRIIIVFTGQITG